MELPKWTVPSLQGAVAGAVALTIIGFNWGGWVTEGTASKMTQEASNSAVAAALTPHCLARSVADPASADIMADLDKAGTWQKRSIIEKAGWATPLGSEKPSWELAESCLMAILKRRVRNFLKILLNRPPALTDGLLAWIVMQRLQCVC